jgi:hypothetical protein
MEVGMVRKRRRAGALVGLFLLALVLRTWRGTQEVIANPDIMRFVDQMRRLAADPLGTIRTESYHPLQASLGLLVHEVVGAAGLWHDERMGWIWALRIVGILAGSLLTVQIVWLARWFGAPFWASWAAGAMWMIGRRTSVYGSDGLSDMLTWSLFSGGMLLAMPALRALQRRRGGKVVWWRWLLAGVLSGAAYLARPEGALAVVILTGTLGIHLLLRQRGRAGGRGGRRFKALPRRRIGIRQAAPAAVILLAGFLLLAGPYMAIIGQFTAKKSLAKGHAESDTQVMSPQALIRGGAYEKIEKISIELQETFSWGAWMVVLLAVLYKPRLWGRARLRVLAIVWILAWDAVMYWLIGRAGYLDGRHTLPSVLLLQVLFALALAAWTRPMAAYMARRRRDAAGWAALPPWRRWRGWPRVFGLGVCVVAGMPGIVMLTERPRRDKMDLAEAAQWVRGHVRSDVVVCDFERLVGYYSGNPYGKWNGLQRKFGVDASGDPAWLKQVEALKEASGAPAAVIGKVYFPGEEEVKTEVGEYQEVARFISPSATNRDVFVLYARPFDPWRK